MVVIYGGSLNAYMQGEIRGVPVVAAVDKISLLIA